MVKSIAAEAIETKLFQFELCVDFNNVTAAEKNEFSFSWFSVYEKRFSFTTESRGSEII